MNKFSIIVLVLLFALFSVDGKMMPPKVAQEFSNEFDLIIPTEDFGFNLKLSGNLSISYKLVAGHLNFSTCYINGTGYSDLCLTANQTAYYNLSYIKWWEGLIAPSSSNSYQTNLFVIFDTVCDYIGFFNRSYVNQYFQFNIPSDAVYLGTTPIRGYMCSGWKYQRYGIQYGISYTYSIFENVTQWVDVSTGAIVNLTISEANNQDGTDPYFVANYRANNIVVGGIPRSAYTPPAVCNNITFESPKKNLELEENFSFKSLLQSFHP